MFAMLQTHGKIPPSKEISLKLTMNINKWHDAIQGILVCNEHAHLRSNYKRI